MSTNIGAMIPRCSMQLPTNCMSDKFKEFVGRRDFRFWLGPHFFGYLLVAILAVGQVIVKSCMNSNIRTFFLSVPEVKRCWWWVPCHDENGEIFWSKVFQSKLFSQSTNDHHHRHFLSCNTLQHIRNDFRGILISPIDQFFIIHLW